MFIQHILCAYRVHLIKSSESKIYNITKNTELITIAPVCLDSSGSLLTTTGIDGTFEEFTLDDTPD